MKGIEEQYLDLLKDILENGVVKQTRNGKTRSLFGKRIEHNMQDGFPLLTTKKMFTKGIFTELIWFLRGDTNIKYLVDNSVHIWDGDAYEFLKRKFAKDPSVGLTLLVQMIDGSTKYKMPPKDLMIGAIEGDELAAERWGDLGPVYGKQWRDFNGVDQIQNLITTLKTNPDDRRMIVSAWNPAQMDPMKVALPPCHYGFQIYTRELTMDEKIKWVMSNVDLPLENVAITEETAKETTPQRAISLMFNMRSVDTALGLPFNIASYGLLLEILGKMCNMIPAKLMGNLGDVHIYENQIPGIEEQLKREPYILPKLRHAHTNEWYKTLSENLDIFNFLEPCDFKILGYESHDKINIPLSN